MRVHEVVQVERPARDVYADLADPERRAAAGWRSVAGARNAYEGVLHAAAGPIEIDLDCRFEVEQTHPGERVRIRGTGASPRIAFAVDAQLDVRASDGTATVELTADVAVSGELAGLGQRRVREQARRLLAAYVTS